jgi:hypothetical protein
LTLLTKSPCVVAVLFVFVFIVSSSPVSAIDRVGGQFWAYDASMTVAGLNVTGTVTYTLSGQDSVVSGDISYEADILTISGNLSASSTLFGAPYSVFTVLGGARFESKDGTSTIREDLIQWTNISIGSAPIQLLTRMKKEVITTYAPPYLSKFNPTTTHPGDAWIEPIDLNMTTIVNGTQFQSISNSGTYSVVVASSMENVEVDAGTFETLKITTTDSTGARNVYWWSSKVQNFVVEKSYDALSSQPSATLYLKDFDSSSGRGTLITVIVGAVVVVVAMVILGAIISSRRKMDPVPPIPPQVGLPGQVQGPPARPGVDTPGPVEKQPKR